MVYEWDEEKRKANLEKHGVDFVALESFDWEDTVVLQDDRYSEPRFVAFGPIEGRLHCVWFTKRGSAYRIIGVRKANRREVKRHG